MSDNFIENVRLVITIILIVLRYNMFHDYVLTKQKIQLEMSPLRIKSCWNGNAKLITFSIKLSVTLYSTDALDEQNILNNGDGCWWWFLIENFGIVQVKQNYIFFGQVLICPKLIYSTPSMFHLIPSLGPIQLILMNFSQWAGPCC